MDSPSGENHLMEFETWEGSIPYRFLYKLGLIPLMDGSLRHDGVMSYEYATIPLKGTEGLSSIQTACDYLQKYTSIHPLCSLHLHIGGYKRSQDFIVALYKIAVTLQKELYGLFPKYYQKTSYFKSKDYCKPFPRLPTSDDLGKSFDNVYSMLSGGEPFEGFHGGNHPADPDNQHKWNISARYYFINLVPFIWGNRGTIEFRMHPPTTNSTKAINWIFLSNAILRYANLYRHNWNYSFKDLSLSRVFYEVYDRTLADYLDNYVHSLRVERSRYDSLGDFTGLTWCKEDEDFTFNKAPLLTSKFNQECYTV